jgi:PKHD-type hydroxylase
VFLPIEELIDPVTVAVLRDEAAELSFEDGAKTAGRFAREVKANDQAAASSARDAVLEVVARALQANPLFAAAARPKAMTPLILSRYRAGQTYGLHVDDAEMGGLRTDISFTLFLSPPETYDGGALIIEDSLETRAVKLSAGSVFLYPSTTLHRVQPVTAGERLAVVGWVQSRVRSAEKREILFDLDRSIAELHASVGKSALFDTLCKTRSNLLRMWVET